MATHKLELAWDVIFEDGSVEELQFQNCYYFADQKYKYLICWLEELIKEKDITSRPIEIREKYKVIECEHYKIVIGL